MLYSDFSLEAAVENFALQPTTAALFPNLTPVPVPTRLAERLREGEPYAFRSEKARSEFIIAPVLLAVTQLWQGQISIYSGQRFDVDVTQGLSGECDFILSATEPLPIVRAPVVSIVEAKKANLEAGYGQCAAQLVAALRFNQRHADPKPFVYGCVSTGRVWRFLRLEGTLLTFDTHALILDDLATDVGTVLAAFGSALAISLAP